tara:strand:+ start:3294 stop:4553 length:1260 start_codon:yes stop_codon:yes gene_type:complete
VNWKELSQTQDYVFAGAVSGGLDSCTVAHWLSDKGVDVHCFTVDLGQPDEKKLDDVSTRMLGSGAKSSNILDGKNDLAEAGLKVIQSQARYEGGYWNTTGIARPVTVQQILPEMKKLDIDVLFHGATGRGNDQVRFQLASNMINPNVQVYAPWRDQEFLQQFPGRQQMLDYCEKNLIPIKPSKESRYSTDANFLGLTHEAGDLENISISPDFVETIMGQWPWNAKENPDYVTIKWDKGVPVEINGTQLSLVDAFTTANKIAGDHGVGIGTHVIENRFVGIKSRGIYESPGMELLGQSYEFLLQFILDRRSRELFSDLSSTISRQIYQGYWLDLSTSMSLNSIDLITQFATGTIQVKLYKGGVYFDSADDSLNSMPHSLYTNDGSMEDEGGYDHSDAEGFLNVLGVSAKNFGEKFKNLRS